MQIGRKLKVHVDNCTLVDLIQDKVSRSEVIVTHNAPFDIRCLELIEVNFLGKRIFDAATQLLFMKLKRLPNYR